MNIIILLLQKFLVEEQGYILFLLFLNILLNFVETIGFSYTVANIIDSMEKSKTNKTTLFLQYFAVLSVLYITVYSIYKHYQITISAKLRQWLKYQLIRLVFLYNNENLSGINFIKLNSPIVRISTICFMIVNDVITYLIPIMTFLIIIFSYFLYLSPVLSGVFLLGNAIFFTYFLYNFDDIILYNTIYETNVGKTESYAIELLHNIDQIIYRGQINKELDEYKTKNQHCIDTATKFYSTMNYYSCILNIIIFILLFSCILYIIQMNYKNEISIQIFISLFSILLLYRDKMIIIVQQYPDFIEFIGRMNSVIKVFEYMDSTFDEYDKNGDSMIDLVFQQIKFENVNFRYKKEDPLVFENKNLVMELDNKIIGIVGPSGSGKSTLMKLVLKIYKLESGTISIDGVSIENLDSAYIRKHISYVNQNSKLFDKKVIENIYYGCPDFDSCRRHYDEIMKYRKIRDLFQDIDMENKDSGSGGANLSGGQRQVINIINALIRPCEILILDEPTNALDGELKRDLLSLITYFKKYKKCIVIISHDVDVYYLFDKKINI
jgi:ATP-binding cassette subfamily B protein